QQEHDPRHQGGDLESGEAVGADDAGEDDDERAGGACDLDPAATDEGDDDAGDDGGVEPLLGLDTGGDGEGHREGQRDDPDDEAGDDVARPLAATQQAGARGFENGDHPVGTSFTESDSRDNVSLAAPRLQT